MFADSTLLENTIKKPSPRIRLLTPFDNSVIHRERLKQIFNLDFRLECYTPKEKRTANCFEFHTMLILMSYQRSNIG